MNLLRIAPIMMLLLLMPALAVAIEPIIEIKGVEPVRTVFDNARRGTPLELKDAEQAAKHFDKEQLAALGKQVDFEKQFVLLFAWRGSGQDRLEFVVAESFPEQITFQIKPGRTRDLRPHVRIFALRNGVTWNVK